MTAFEEGITLRTKYLILCVASSLAGGVAICLFVWQAVVGFCATQAFICGAMCVVCIWLWSVSYSTWFNNEFTFSITDAENGR